MAALHKSPPEIASPSVAFLHFADDEHVYLFFFLLGAVPGVGSKRNPLETEAGDGWGLSCALAGIPFGGEHQQNGTRCQLHD
ncbi:hypothetical protein TNCV_1089471 [Trichonephila clavipes]|uniref:Uncharacterized protein n=1 Tax=Trichonephila clavipes TaxID=2585209 RepID=A0A8X6SPE5_TRICX|nr:hypothetical protein TNCV_1089471 [Trichonephila clavipes]